MNGLYYYKLVSPYPEDVTKNCKLTINEIDSNFLTLKDNDIKKAEFVKEDKTLVLTRNNGEKIIAPFNDGAWGLNVNAICDVSGTTLTISYDGAEGKKSITIENILTAENLEDVLGENVLTKVITDSTLRGNGTVSAPLGLNGAERTGYFAPVEIVIDLTDGSRLPDAAKLGTRYLTKEYVNDYGYLYNGAATEKIKANLEAEGKGWRIPSKADWDALLNSLEPCEYQNHHSAKCHVELGKYAGHYLKSECGWNGQPACTCVSTKPITSCTIDSDDEFVDDSGLSAVTVSPIGIDKYGMTILPAGYALIDTHNRILSQGFSEEGIFWTTSHIYNDPNQDIYVKQFVWNMSGVEQMAVCPSPYYSVRLVKDYDGSNYFDSEYIDGVLYKTVLFPESKQVWLATNYAKKEGFDQSSDIPELVEVNNGLVNEKRAEFFINEWNGHYWEKKMTKEGDTLVVEKPCFDDESISSKTVCWDDKDGEHHCIDVEIPVTEQRNLEYRVYTTDDCDKVLVNTDDLVTERIMDILTPLIIEESVEREAADKALDEKIDAETARATSAETDLWEAIEEEASERIEGDEQLWNAIEEEASARTEVEAQLWEAINEEASARTDVDNQIWEALNNEIQGRLDVDSQMWAAINAEAEARESTDALLWDAINTETARAQEVEAQLWNGINGETERAQEVEGQLWDALNAEIERAKAREDEIDGQLIDVTQDYEIKAAVDVNETNLTFKSKDGNPEHFIDVKFNGNFGEI